jgi:hypothetical protein
MQAASISETSASFHQTTQYNNLEDSHNQRVGCCVDSQKVVEHAVRFVKNFVTQFYTTGNRLTDCRLSA